MRANARIQLHLTRPSHRFAPSAQGKFRVLGKSIPWIRQGDTAGLTAGHRDGYQ
jgi:hypothetical protein